jgi:hypothetical protein
MGASNPPLSLNNVAVWHGAFRGRGDDLVGHEVAGGDKLAHEGSGGLTAIVQRAVEIRKVWSSQLDFACRRSKSLFIFKGNCFEGF